MRRIWKTLIGLAIIGFVMGVIGAYVYGTMTLLTCAGLPPVAAAIVTVVLPYLVGIAYLIGEEISR